MQTDLLLTFFLDDPVESFLQNATGCRYTYPKGQPGSWCGIPNNRIQEGAKKPSQDSSVYPDYIPSEADPPDSKVSC